MGLDNYKAYQLRDEERDSINDMLGQIKENNQPDSSKREDPEKGCGARNSIEI